MSLPEYKLVDSLPKKFNCQGIYGIKSIKSGKYYVGSSVDVRNRINKHINNLNKKESDHHSKALQRAWNKYEQKNFVAIILEKVSDQNKLIIREQYWIDKLDSYHNGYNARPYAEANYGMEWSEEQNRARQKRNLEAWSNLKLRKELGNKFKGRKRGQWTTESHKKVSSSLKKAHEDNPQWKEKIFKATRTQEALEKKREGIRKSLENPVIRKRRLAQLKEASQKEHRLNNLREAYFKKHSLQKFGILSLEEFEQSCITLYKQGYSLREIGRKYNIDHKSIANLLRRLGITVEKRYAIGMYVFKRMCTELRQI